MTNHDRATEAARAVAALRAYADDLAAGHAPLPVLDWVQVAGRWCQRVPGRVHDLLCPHPRGGTVGDLIDCESCGLVYPSNGPRGAAGTQRARPAEPGDRPDGAGAQSDHR